MNERTKERLSIALPFHYTYNSHSRNVYLMNGISNTSFMKIFMHSDALDGTALDWNEEASNGKK